MAKLFSSAVTWQPPRKLTIALFSALLAVTQLTDAVCTLAVLDLGVEEGNPLMAWVLEAGTGWFLACKLTVALFSTAVFWVASRRCRWGWCAHRLIVLGLLFLTGYHLIGAHLLAEFVR